MAYTSAPILVVIGLAVTVVGLVEAGPIGLVSLVLALVGGWGMSTLRQRAVLTETDLTVGGRFSRRHVDLHRVTAVHEDRTHTVWLAAEDQRPFRVYYARPVQSEREPERSFVMSVRWRAAACGASVRPDDEVTRRPPPGTAPLFTL